MSLKRPSQIPYETSGLTDVFEVRGGTMQDVGNETVWDLLDGIPDYDPTQIAKTAIDLSDPDIGTVGAYAEAHLASFTNESLYHLGDAIKLLVEGGHVEIDPAELFKQSGYDDVPAHVANRGLANYSQFISSLWGALHGSGGRTEEGDIKSGGWEVEGDDVTTGADLGWSIHREITAMADAAEFEELTGLMLSEPDICKRAQFALDYEAYILQYCHENEVKIILSNRDRGEIELPIDLQSLANLGYTEMLSDKKLPPEWAIEGAAIAINATLEKQKFEEKFCEVDGIVLPERLEELRLVFGTKAASLIALSEVIERVKLAKGGTGHEFSIPQFKAVPSDLYVRWKDGEDIDDELMPYYNWASNLMTRPSRQDESRDSSTGDFIVRSSAVYAEDGEELSGAGIYDSVVVEQHRGHLATFEDFKAAVLGVYNSVDSEDAVRYRQQHGILREEMGLVVQKHVKARYTNLGTYGGYINTVMPGVPGLLEIRAGRYKRNMYHREPLFRVLGEGEGLEPHQCEVELFPSDIGKVDVSILNELAEDAAIIERIWGKPVQIEFVYSDEKPGISIVQVRNLTAKETEPVDTYFPDEPEIVECQAVGVGNMVLRMLQIGDDNSRRAGVVVAGGNLMWTKKGNIKGIPESGAVVLLNNSGDNGHIQTVCAEEGVVCLFPDEDKIDGSNDYTALLKEDQLRVVSNGIKARVYRVTDDERLE